MTPSTWLVLKDSKICWIKKMPELCAHYDGRQITCDGHRCACERLTHAAIESAPEVINREVIGVFRLGKSGYFAQPDKTKYSFSITDRVPFEVKGWGIKKLNACASDVCDSDGKCEFCREPVTIYKLVPAEETKEVCNHQYPRSIENKNRVCALCGHAEETKDVDHYYKEAHGAGKPSKSDLAFVASYNRDNLNYIKPVKEDLDLDRAAIEYAKSHSSAPDKETPDWIINDFKAGAHFVLGKEIDLTGIIRNDLYNRILNRGNKAVKEETQEEIMREMVRTSYSKWPDKYIVTRKLYGGKRI